MTFSKDLTVLSFSFLISMGLLVMVLAAGDSWDDFRTIQGKWKGMVIMTVAVLL